MDHIQAVQDLRDCFTAAKDGLVRRHSTWDGLRDARITVFSKGLNVLNSTHLGFVFIRFNLTRPEWWTAISPSPIPDTDKQIYVAEFDTFLKLGFLQFLFASVESSFRAILRAVDPSACSGGTAEFKSIYDCLLTRLGLTRHIPLLDLLRLIRNTVHNNGVYFHRSGQSETVVFQGESYAFLIGRPVSFVTWSFLLGLGPHLRDLILDVVEAELILAPSAIRDPFAPEQ